MSAMTPARALYLDVAPDPVFAQFHAPDETLRRPTGVLICPPWGWDEVTSYRARREWADRLAAAGHPVLRIDLPGSGDSDGTPGDPARLDAWTGAIAAAAGWLRSSAGCARIAVIGLGVGGLAAGTAIAHGAPVDDLVLWAAPVSGRAFLREARAFARLQTSRYSLAGGQEPQTLPEGWLEIGGFVISEATIHDLEPLALGGLDLGRLQRALLLERDGIAVDAALRDHLTAAGVDVTVAAGPGWGAMCFHPERYAPPLEVFERVSAWLAKAPTGAASVPLEGPPIAEIGEADIRVGDARIRESPIVLDLPAGRIFGILAEPEGTARSVVCAVFLNAGAVRRIGPNRLWVEAARRWAAQGIPTLRLDLEGIGDSDGDARRFVDVREFYADGVGNEVQAALDELERRGTGRRFVLVGLCSGAFWAFHQAARDPRVTATFLLNVRALVWDPELHSRREARKVEAVFRVRSWRRLLGGSVDAARMRSVARAILRQAAQAARRSPGRLMRRAGSVPTRDPLDAFLDRLHASDTRVVIAFSGDEPLADELRSDGFFDRVGQWSNVSVRDLPGRDHTVRPIAAQIAVHELLDAELEAELGRDVGDAPPANGGQRHSTTGAGR